MEKERYKGKIEYKRYENGEKIERRILRKNMVGKLREGVRGSVKGRMEKEWGKQKKVEKKTFFIYIHSRQSVAKKWWLEKCRYSFTPGKTLVLFAQVEKKNF